MKHIHTDYPSWVKEVLRQIGWLQKDLAKESGVSHSTVNRWKNGQSKPPKLVLSQLDVY